MMGRAVKEEEQPNDTASDHYSDQVLGKTVWILFDHDDGSPSSYYRGVIKEFHIVLLVDHNSVAARREARQPSRAHRHVVAFDDGTSEKFDLVEEERAGRLQWRSPTAAVVTPPRKKVKREKTATPKEEDKHENASAVESEQQQQEEDVKPKARMKHETDTDRENIAEQEEEEEEDKNDDDFDLDDSEDEEDEREVSQQSAFATTTAATTDEQDFASVEQSPEIRRVLNKFRIPESAFAKGIERVNAYIKAFPVEFKDMFPLLDFMIPAGTGNSTHVDLLFTDRANRPGNTARRFLRKLKKQTSRNETEEMAVGWHTEGKQWNPENPEVLRALLKVLHEHYEEIAAKNAKKLTR